MPKKKKGNTNKNLHEAIRAKKDDFYTLLPDIVNELKHYREHFKGKVVYCNCDDPYESNFFQYFVLNFRLLELKKLICTCYDGSPVAGTQLELAFPEDEPKPEPKRVRPKRVAHKIVITSVKEFYNPDSGFNLDDIKKALRNGTKAARIEKLKENGDFRSEECVELLKEADIVVTNPPYSLFSEYVAQLVEYGKKFLILGNKNAITYKEIFPLIRENKMWVGVTPMSKDIHFIIPQGYIDDAVEANRPNAIAKGENGQIFGRSPSAWFTNLEHKKRHRPIILYKKYTPEEFPKYDNYDAIEVNKTADIPEDYDGVMGVPITFLDKYCPEQFELIWTTDRGGDGMLEDLKLPHTRYDAPVVKGKGLYKRILIRRK